MRRPFGAGGLARSRRAGCGERVLFAEPSNRNAWGVVSRALVVDDNTDIRLLIEQILRMLGIATVHAPGGREALEILDRDGAPDLIVLDIQMPVMDGWETLNRIRASATVGHVPVILCTVSGAPEDILRAWELGCDAYVAKPVDARALMETAQALLTRSAMERRQIRATETLAARHALMLANG